MSFEHPAALWLLLVLLCLLLGLWRWGWLARRSIAATLRLDVDHAFRRHAEKYVLAGAISVLLVGAMASPRLSHFSAVGAHRSGEVALLVDVSASMAARKEPETPTRLERTQTLLCQLVDGMAALKDVRISLHAFTTIARSHVPFVGQADYTYLRESIKHVLGVYSVPGQGTSIGRPLQQVLDKFSTDSKARLVVLFSDGEPFVGLSRGMHDLEQRWIDEAVAKAKEKGVRVVTVGVGEPEGARIPIYDESGHFAHEYATLQGADFVSYLDAKLLTDVAERTGGKYFAEGDSEGLAAYVEQSLSLEAPAGAPEQVESYGYLGHWLLLGALPLWLLLAGRHLLP